MQFPETTIRREETSEMRRNKSLFASFLKSLENNEVHVGWFGGRNREGRNNPTIAYVNEVGSYATDGKILSTDFKKQIPPRPFIRPAIQQDGEKISKEFAKDIKESLKDLDVAIKTKAFFDTGERIKKAIQHQIETGGFLPISEYTQQMRFEEGRSGVDPLYDTGELYDSIEYKITSKTDTTGDEPF